MGSGTYGLEGRSILFPTGNVSNSPAGELIGYGVELYLDDCIVFGETVEEFALNLWIY